MTQSMTDSQYVEYLIGQGSSLGDRAEIFAKAMKYVDVNKSNNLDLSQLQNVLSQADHAISFLELKKLIGTRETFTFKDVVMLGQGKAIAKTAAPSSSAPVSKAKTHQGALAEKLNAMEASAVTHSSAPSLEELKARNAISDVRTSKAAVRPCVCRPLRCIAGPSRSFSPLSHPSPSHWTTIRLNLCVRNLTLCIWLLCCTRCIAVPPNWPPPTPPQPAGKPGDDAEEARRRREQMRERLSQFESK